jgi:hypothetical protein
MLRCHASRECGGCMKISHYINVSVKLVCRDTKSGHGALNNHQLKWAQSPSQICDLSIDYWGILANDRLSWFPYVRLDLVINIRSTIVKPKLSLGLFQVASELNNASKVYLKYQVRTFILTHIKFHGRRIQTVPIVAFFSCLPRTITTV